MPLDVHRTVAELNGRERAILSAMLYFDIFGHPLTAEEISRYSPAEGLTADEARTLCRGVSLDAIVREEEGFYVLRSASGASVRHRIEREALARRLWRIARLVGWIVAAFPFVRSVCVSGELSKGVAGPTSDIDLVVVADEGRLWIVRTMLVIFKHVFLFGRRRYFCINHLQTIDHLATTSQSYYDAVEVVTLRRAGGEPVFNRFLEANPWIAQVLPNVTAERSEDPNAGLTQRRRWRRPLSSGMIDRLDVWLMSFWERTWVRRYPDLSLVERRRRFACTPYFSTAYGSDSMEPIMTAWRARLSEHGLTPIGTAAA